MQTKKNAINSARGVTVGLFSDEDLYVSYNEDNKRFSIHVTSSVNEKGMEAEIAQKVSFFLKEELSTPSPDVSYSNVIFNKAAKHYDLDYTITLSRGELKTLLDERRGIKGALVQGEARERCEFALETYPIKDPIPLKWTEIIELDNDPDKGPVR